MTRASIDVITELTPNGAPILRAYCGNACGNFVEMQTQPGEDLGSAVAVFLEKTKAQGWAIGLMGNFCPAHVRQISDQQPRIHRPGAATIIPPSGVTH